jgi:hypothetical protein
MNHDCVVSMRKHAYQLAPVRVEAANAAVEDRLHQHLVADDLDRGQLTFVIGSGSLKTQVDRRNRRRV